MGNQGSQPGGGSGVPYGDALTAVVKGLKDPYLLFGLGAGIILVGALTFTGNVTLVLIVACVLVVALLARLVANMQSARERPPGGIAQKIKAANADLQRSPVGSVKGDIGGPVTQDIDVSGAHAVGSPIGQIDLHLSPSQKEADDHGDDRPSGS